MCRTPPQPLRERGIDPKSFVRYNEGASHAANELAVVRLPLAHDELHGKAMGHG